MPKNLLKSNKTINNKLNFTMKQIQNSLLLLLLVSITAIACHKHEHEDDAEAPAILITSPAVNASISGAVAIAGIITDDSLHEMSITVTKDSDNTVLFTATPTVHNLTSYTIAETWTPASIAAETAVSLTVEVEDHGGNFATQIVKFMVKP